MMYVDFKAGNEEYKLRLTTRSVVGLEKQLGCNPLAIFGNGDKVPTVTTMVQVLHASLQAYQHNITMDDAYTIFDKYLENNVMTDFIPVMVDIFKVSGLIKEDRINEEDSKN